MKETERSYPAAQKKLLQRNNTHLADTSFVIADSSATWQATQHLVFKATSVKFRIKIDLRLVIAATQNET